MTKKALVLNAAFWLLLATLLLSFDYLIKLGVGHSTYSHYNKVNIIAGHKVDPCIAIFGSSVGEVGLNSKLISDSMRRTTYNFSIDGTRFTQFKGLIKELNDYSDSCRLIILAETFFSLNKTDRLMAVDRYMAHINNNNIYESLYMVQPDIAWKLRYVPFYDFIVMKHEYIKASVYGLKNWLAGYTNRDSYLGYTPKNANWQADVDSLNKIGHRVGVAIDSTVYYGYKEVIKEIRQRGRKVLIVLTPIYKDGLLLIDNLESLKNAYASLTEEGVFFADYSNSPLSKDKNYFYNNSHLNNIGADIFSTMLLKDVQRILDPGFGNPGIKE